MHGHSAWSPRRGQAARRDQTPYGLEVADGLISTGVCKNILLAGAEVMSKVVNWEDRNTCVLFGDGAGVVIVSATEEDRGIYTSCWGAEVL